MTRPAGSMAALQVAVGGAVIMLVYLLTAALLRVREVSQVDRDGPPQTRPVSRVENLWITR